MKLLALFTLTASLSQAQIFPRQTSAPFNNGTLSSTPSSNTVGSVTGTGAASSITSPPPCCWVIAGTLAVGFGRWWTSSVAETVATVVTNYMRNNDTTILLNSSTIYRPANETFAAESYSFYLAGQLLQSHITSPISIPTNLLTGAGADLNNIGPDYAGTSIISGTVETFDFTDLKITSPTAFDAWFDLGILTVYPSLSSTPPGMKSFEPTMCGTWSTPTDVSYSTIGTSTSYTTAVQSGITYAATYTDYDYTPVTTVIEARTLVPYWWSYDDFFRAPLWLAGFPDISEPTLDAAPLATWGAIALNATYIQPVASQMPDGEAYVNFPPGLMPWLAAQPSIKSRFPFIEGCWSVIGQGQPTVHVPVVQLTVPSTNYIEMTGSITSSTSAPVSQANSPAVPPSEKTLLTPAPTTTPVMPPAKTETSQTQSNTVQSASTAEAQSVTQGSESGITPETVLLRTTASSNNLGGLFSAIPSVVQQSEQSAGVSAGAIAGETTGLGQPGTVRVQTQTQPSASSPQTPAASSTGSTPVGYAIGTQTVSPNESAVSSGGTVYSALPSGSGVQVVANGQTSTILGPATSEGAVYVANGQTITRGSAMTVSGTTYSALPSGSGIQVIAAGTTSTVQYPTIATLSPTLTTLPNGQVISSISPATKVALSITIGGGTLPYSSIASNEVVIGSEALTAGGPAVTENEQTLSLGTQGCSVVLIANGASTIALPTSLAGTQLVTIGGQIFTAYAAASSALVIDGVTVYLGAATVVDGETVSISGTELVVGSGASTTTEGLSPAILSGLGGSHASSLSSQAAYTGAAREVIGNKHACCLLGIAALCHHLV